VAVGVVEAVENTGASEGADSGDVKNAPGGNTPGLKSPGWNAPGGTLPGLKSPGWNAPGWNAPGGTPPGLKSPGWNAPGGNPPGWNTPGGNPPGWKSPGWNAPGWNAPGLNVPGGGSVNLGCVDKCQKGCWVESNLWRRDECFRDCWWSEFPPLISVFDPLPQLHGDEVEIINHRRYRHRWFPLFTSQQPLTGDRRD
jgi:hypothetical protein